jgi:hypothetical protein
VYAGDEFGFRGVKEERYGGDDAVRPEFGSPPMQLDEAGAEVWALHQYLVGLRRRHPWLHAASTTAVRLENRHYVYRVHSVYRVDRTSGGDDSSDALLVALNIDDEPMHLELSALGAAQADVLAGSAAPPQQVVDAVVVEPHGWRILRPV